MDWTKAKTILIIALLLTNLFLIFTYGGADNSKKNVTDEEALVKVLESKNIYLHMEIPKKHKNMPAVTVENRNIDENEVQALLNQQKAIDVDAEDSLYIEAASDFINYIGAMTDHVVFDKITRNDRDVVVSYRAEVNKYRVEKSHISCVFESGKMVKYDTLWLEPTQTSNKKMSTISAAAALIVFMSDQAEEEKINVDKMEMVYWVAETTYDSNTAIIDTAFPAWKITYNDGKQAYIDAVER